MKKNVYIYSNDVLKSIEIQKELIEKLHAAGFDIRENLDENVDLIICVGGDGTLLSLMHELEFPTIPIAGINTGHLGFFQEIDPDKIQYFIDQYLAGNYHIQPYNIAKAEIKTTDGLFTRRTLNEFAIKGLENHSVHLDVSINDSFIEKFSGDGLLVSTPAGSTAYNYSLGGSLVDPRLHLLQVTPIAPMNTTAYRALTSSVLIPGNDKVIISPEGDYSKTLSILFDGVTEVYENIEYITLILSRREINLVRLNDTTFWDKVKGKFL